MKSRTHNLLYYLLIITTLLGSACAHYPVNKPISSFNPADDKMRANKESNKIAILLTFSGGGMRAAAFSYGVLEELKDTRIILNGKDKRLLDEVTAISSVSGGSFTAAYYGLFGDGIFQDFESKFLKKDIQGELAARIFLDPHNWIRLLSPYFDRNDLAAEYYDKCIFEGGTFGNIAGRKGPVIIINATDMTSGLRVEFTKNMFDVICSDLVQFPVARAVAASSAVPAVMTPITLKNYAGSCKYEPPANYETMLCKECLSARQSFIVKQAAAYLDSQKKPYIHLLDGGIADNLGLRAILDRMILKGSFWESIKGTPLENVREVVIIIVNAETEPDSAWDKLESAPPFAAMLKSYATIAIQRYNVETVALLKESMKGWAEQVHSLRCLNSQLPVDKYSCGNIRFYVINVSFDALRDEEERRYFNQIPTSFKLSSEEVDKLRAAARRILQESIEFQRLLKNYRQ